LSFKILFSVKLLASTLDQSYHLLVNFPAKEHVKI